MRYQAFVQTAAGVLAAAILSGTALAQSQTEPRTDTAPAPAEERSSVGAVILMDEPVIAQRQMMQQMMARTVDTRMMGAGPARMLQRELTKEDLREKRTQDAVDFHKKGAGALTE